MIRYLVVLALLWPLAVFAGKAYKWVDEEGNVHYSQHPPSDQQKLEKTFDTPAASKQAGDEVQPEEAAGEEEEVETENEEDISGLTREQLAERNCQRAREYRDSLDVSGPVAITREDGNLDELDEAGKQAELQKAKRLVEQHCGDGDAGEGGENPVEEE